MLGCLGGHLSFKVWRVHILLCNAETPAFAFDPWGWDETAHVHETALNWRCIWSFPAWAGSAKLILEASTP